jgi:ferrous iron transport protein A
MTFLSKMIPGQEGTIVGYTDDNPIARRLTELGLVPGRRIQYLRNAPLRDPLEIQVGASFLSLRRAEAALVTIEIDDTD